MSGLATLERPAGRVDEDSAKRRQIVEGARAVFLAQGFDAASMNDIARAAGVSKGTLYVYFKRQGAIVRSHRRAGMRAAGGRAFSISIPNDHDVEAVLTRLGFAYVRFLCRPEKASAIRTVIAIAERMPELGPQILRERTGAKGSRELAAYIAAQVEAGVLDVEDCEIAAAQLMEAYQAMLFKSMVFNFVREPSPQQIERVVRIAVESLSRRLSRAGDGLTGSRQSALPRRLWSVVSSRRLPRNRIAHVGGVALPEEGVVDVRRVPPPDCGTTTLQTTCCLLVEIVLIGIFLQRSGFELIEQLVQRRLGARGIAVRQGEALLHAAIDQHAGEGQRRNADQAEQRAIGIIGRRRSWARTSAGNAAAGAAIGRRDHPLPSAPLTRL